MSLSTFTHSILFRIIFAGLCMILVGSTVRYTVLSDFLREDMTEVVSEQQMSLANYVANDIGHKILMRQYRLQHMASQITPDIVYGSQLTTSHNFGKSSPFEALFSAGILLTSAEGRIINNTTIFDWKGHPDELVPHEALNRPAHNTVFIGKPLVIPGQISPILPMTLVLTDVNEKPWAFLTGFTLLYSPDFLGNLLQARIGSTGSGFLLISPKDRVFIAASNPQKVLTNTPPDGKNLLHDHAMQGYRGTGITTNAHDIEEISAIVSVPHTDWFIVSAIATAEALGTVERVRLFLLRNTAVTIFFLFVILTILVPLSLRPLTRATRQADKMSRGIAPLQPLPGANKGEVGVLINAFNRLLAKLQQQQTELSRAAHHDALTGLPNRRLLSDRIETALANARRQHTKIALLFIDLDEFKPVNDTLGHEAGDQILKMVAERLTGLIRATDSVARLGGDEFVVLLTHLGEDAVKATEAMAGKLMAALKEPFELEGTVCTIGTSVGAIISDGHLAETDLLRQADVLMYEAKAAGRGRYVVKDAVQAPAENHVQGGASHTNIL